MLSRLVERWPKTRHSEEANESPVRMFRLGLGMLLLGLICRLYVYWLSFPIWRDEASLALNFVNRDFRGLLVELENFQIAPLLFLWIEKAVYCYLGPTPAFLRLAPLLAGLGGFLVFWHLARHCLTPRATALAIAIFAVAQTPIHLASMVKPYSFDLLAATVLLTMAIHYLRSPDRATWLALLSVVIPFVVAASYPAIFVAASVSLVLLPVVGRKGGRSTYFWFAAFNLLCLGTFAAHLRFVGWEGHDPTLPDVQTYMRSFWNGAFLPHKPLAALRWLWCCHTGHLFSYPWVFNGGGLMGLLVAVVGARALYRQRQFSLLALCLLPLALNFVASALRRYPYAGDQRLEQHLAPGLCLLLGSGMTELIRGLPVGRKLAIASLATLLGLVGLFGAMRDTLHPYQDVEAAWAERIAQHLSQEIQPQDQIVFPHKERFTLNCLRWQLLPFRQQVRSFDAIDWSRLKRNGGRLWFVDQIVEQAPVDWNPSPRDPRKRLPELARAAWHSVRWTRFQVCEPKTDMQQVFHYCCDLYLGALHP